MTRTTITIALAVILAGCSTLATPLAMRCERWDPSRPDYAAATCNPGGAPAYPYIDEGGTTWVAVCDASAVTWECTPEGALTMVELGERATCDGTQSAPRPTCATGEPVCVPIPRCSR